MKNKIQEVAKSVGIERISFTNTTKFDGLFDLLNYRTNNNYNCEFEESDISKRLDASFLLQNCKTIITAMIPYAKGYKVPKENGMGNLSVSSHGRDYHKSLHEKLEEFILSLKKDFEFNYKICVDTTPLIDRYICCKSGLGYIGKNSMLIDDEYGSFTFLASILTDLDISDSLEDEACISSSKCGNCNICIKKCPNNAILEIDKTKVDMNIEQRVIDTKKCVSYLTQTKQYIPIEYRKAMGTQIYGCDMCQINCPKNYKILNQTSEEDYNSLLVDLRELFKMTNKEFAFKYGEVAGSWRGKNIWKRNAIIVCANMELTNFYDLIKEELYGNSEMFKTYASWALLKLDVQKSKNLLYNMIKYESESISKEYRKLLEMN